MRIKDLVQYLDTLLHTAEIADVSQNGLQVEGSDDITKVAFAVDASLASIEQAVSSGAQMLIVHHGIYWDKPLCATGPMYKRLKALIDGSCALYASHLPLDMHPVYGNNAVIAQFLDLKDITPFGTYHGVVIGYGGTIASPLSATNVAALLTKESGKECIVYSNNSQSSRVAIISGGGAFALDEAASKGFDTFITGETSHASFHYAAEQKISMIFGGHYATETFGVKALMKHIEKEFKIKTVFIDLPTGM